MGKRIRKLLKGAAMLLALVLATMPLPLAHAQEPEFLNIRLETTDTGYKCLEGCEAVTFENDQWGLRIQVEPGRLVKLTFIWAHQGWIEEKHIMILEGLKLEWDQIDYYNREATVEFLADKVGTSTFKCDLECELHDYLQRGTLKVQRKAATPPAPVSTPTSPAASSAVATPTPASTTPSPEAIATPIGGSATSSPAGIVVPTPAVSAPAPIAPAAPAPTSPYKATTITIAPSSRVTLGEVVTLTALLKDNKGAPVSKAEVKFYLDAQLGGTEAQMEIGAARTDKNGVAFVDYTPTLAASKYLITAHFEGMGLYEESEEAIELQQIGVPPSAYSMAPIGLERIRGLAQVGLAGVILTVWAAFGFILFQALGIARPRTRR